MAANALDTEAVFNLIFWGWNTITRPANYMNACLLRAACRTLSDFDVMHCQLASLAREARPIRELVNASVIPCGWDSDAFCTNLVGASKGESFCITANNKRDLIRLIRQIRTGQNMAKGC